MLLRELMNKDPATLPLGSSLAEALNLMATRRARHIVIVGTEGEVLAVVSDRDLALYYDPIEMTQERWEKGTVDQVMTPNPVTIGSSAPVAEAARLLLKAAVSALPVVDNGTLQGIVSDRDFVRYFARQEG